MSCLEFDFGPPQIPGIFVAPPLVPNLPLPVNFDFCCHFSVTDVLGAQAAIAAINATIQGLGAEANAVAAMVEAEILAVAAPILEQSIALSLSCPLD